VSKITKEIPFGEHTLVLETGEIARQADGAVFASMQGTQVLVTVVANKGNAENKGFFPLMVIYQEKTYAAGKIPGGFNKREGRPSEHETLTSRLIDRPLRPLFPKQFYNEVQVIATVMSLNPNVPADIVAMIGASAALAISGLPFHGPIGAARVGYDNGVYLLNPGPKTQSSLDLIVAGTDDAIIMVESEAKELSEDIMRGGILFGHEMMKNVIKGINELAAEVAKPQLEWTAPEANTALEEEIASIATADITNAYLIKDKTQRYQQLTEIRQQIVEKILAARDELKSDDVLSTLSNLEKNIVRQRILDG